ncbi:hypothetical protein PFDG_05197 [Plasmodium falciparum Dd2]|uniref:Uncharacterized protein n=1 Tax=Plasmodium falciparum (isolate Dd2) TaxID=57267 RepID=A0A0L7MA18_PLAF4|nr:hypothetical protein PFDG_05197 [Plasmodium falciparum Dd2]
MVLVELDVGKDTLFKRAEGMKLLGQKMQKLPKKKKRKKCRKGNEFYGYYRKSYKGSKIKNASYRQETE